MKKIIVSISLVLAVFLSQSSFADHRYSRHGYGNSAYGFNSHRFDRGFNRHYNRNAYRNYNRNRLSAYHYGGGRFNRQFNVSYNYGFNNFGGWGYGHRNRYRNSGGDFVGGLVVGSLLSSATYREPSYERVTVRSRPVVRQREVVYVNNSTPTRSAPPKRRLLRDLQGDCFEIVISPNGDEIRSQIDSSQCSF